MSLAAAAAAAKKKKKKKKKEKEKKEKKIRAGVYIEAPGVYPPPLIVFSSVTHTLSCARAPQPHAATTAITLRARCPSPPTIS